MPDSGPIANDTGHPEKGYNCIELYQSFQIYLALPALKFTFTLSILYWQWPHSKSPDLETVESLENGSTRLALTHPQPGCQQGSGRPPPPQVHPVQHLLQVLQHLLQVHQHLSIPKPFLAPHDLLHLRCEHQVKVVKFNLIELTFNGIGNESKEDLFAFGLQV